MHSRPTDSIENDYVIDQSWSSYTDDDHAVWRDLFLHQSEMLPGRACDEFLRGLTGLGVVADEIPDFEQLNCILKAATNWTCLLYTSPSPRDS